VNRLVPASTPHAVPDILAERLADMAGLEHKAERPQHAWALVEGH
jgi:hypothetical protein